MDNHFDAIIVGAGQAGPPLAGRLTGAGKKVAMVERKLFGGTCVNTGCIPTKTLVASAHAAHLARRAGDFGIAINGSIAVDMKKVKARKDEVSGKSRTGVEGWLRKMEGCTVFDGHARFLDPHTLEVRGQKLSGDQIFLNVGGRATTSGIAGVDEVPYLVNTTILQVDFVPKHLVIVGGSYIGLEFAQMYRRFGSEVTVIEKGPRLLSKEDEDVSSAIKEILESEGIHLRLEAECIRLASHAEGVAVSLTCNSGDPEIIGSHVLVAIGRRPNTDDLGLEAAGVEMDERGYIKTDDQLRTNVPHVWAMGDCNGKGAFTHTSYNDFEIVAANLLDNEARRVSDRITAYGLYIDPALGRAGMTESEIRKAGLPALIGKRPMTRVGRAVEKGETQGFMKVLVHRDTKKILGAAFLGTGGDEAIHSVLDTMYAGAPYTTVTHAMHIHPTVSELIPTILEDLKPFNEAAGSAGSPWRFQCSFQ